MPDATKHKPIVKASIISETPISKADKSVQLSQSQSNTTGDWLEPPYDQLGFEVMVDNSTILPQCIRSYKLNICGFGIGIRYKEDIDETEEMRAEYDKLQKILDTMNFETDIKAVFENIVEGRETFGIAYLEVIRNVGGEVVQVEYVKDTATIRKTMPSDKYHETVFYYNGEEVPRLKKFCKYKQEINGKTVYYKEFGDKRYMDMTTGEYSENADENDAEANELIEFPLGVKPYGKVRWIGQTLSIDGSRRAENLNNTYFTKGRHTPLMISVQGGTLSAESRTALQSYMNNISGENGQHSFLLLEVEGESGVVGMEPQKPTVEIKDIASILQKDELFQDYLSNNRRKVQSAFQLPDIYVGYTTDFNRATAQTAIDVTEEQVFIPERRSLEWVINNKLLNEYQFKYVEVYFRAPDTSNPEDLAKILNVAERAGGVTPNLAKNITYGLLGKTAEDYPDEWGNVPLAYIQTQNAGQVDLAEQVEKQIKKASGDGVNDEIIAVMKEVKRQLLESGGAK